MKNLILLTIISFNLISCSPLTMLTKSEISVLNSTWEYSDEDCTYQIEFGRNGKIKNTHPKNRVHEIDYWDQKQSKIYFQLNNGNSKYRGRMKTIDLIVGHGNSWTEKWKWEMKRIK